MIKVNNVKLNRIQPDHKLSKKTLEIVIKELKAIEPKLKWIDYMNTYNIAFDFTHIDRKKYDTHRLLFFDQCRQELGDCQNRVTEQEFKIISNELKSQNLGLVYEKML